MNEALYVEEAHVDSAWQSQDRELARLRGAKNAFSESEQTGCLCSGGELAFNN